MSDSTTGTPHETVLVVDFGAQYAQLIARRVREANVFSEIVRHDISAADVAARAPKAIILSGGPASVHVDGAPRIDPAVYALGIPILGICYGAQLIAQQLGGIVANTGKGEYGRTALTRTSDTSALLVDLPTGDAACDVWMSHFDSVQEVPAGFVATARTNEIPVAALEDAQRKIYGVQHHPEVGHSAHGQDVLTRFLYDIAGCSGDWTMRDLVEESVAAIRDTVGDEHVVCAVSGGVDSSVVAALVHRAIGDQLTCVYVDTGLMRAGESEQIDETFRDHFGIDLVHVKAGDRYLAALDDVQEPERKRAIIGDLFWKIFAEESRALEDRVGSPVRFFAQGTLYPDVVESGGTSGASSTIKTHHNLVPFPEGLHFEKLEPLDTLFKDEVRKLGSSLGLPDEMVWRQPFPGPGLAVRIIGTITPERVSILQEADAIVTDEIRKAGLERDLWQSFAVLPCVRTVGVMGDERTYAYPIAIRAVTSDDAMTADWARLPYDLLERLSSRIINEVAGVNRVVLDITSKPPGTIEWE